MNYKIVSTHIFDSWSSSLSHTVTQRKILARLARVENGHFGDYKNIAADLYELRFFFNGGLRINYTIRNHQIVLLFLAN